MKRVILPGLIDPHVHLRDPGQTHKEDFYSGSQAALAGGYTLIMDMPNNSVPITTARLLEEKIKIAQQSIVCDLGFHFGTLGNNFKEFPKVADKVLGLKIYLNLTTGDFIIDKDRLLDIYKAWPATRPILLHAEEDVSGLVLDVLRKEPKRTHICHVSSRQELQFVMQAKSEGLPITCGVTPHHLFLSDKDAQRLGPFGHMKPYLKASADQAFLWSHMDAVDIIESDHAPHTKKEKSGPSPPYGVPGLETTLPMMLTAQQQGKISFQKLISLLHSRPAEIFGISPAHNTKIVVSMEEYVIANEGLKTKSGWTPFAGQKVAGRVDRVVLRGKTVYKAGKVLAAPGSGQIIN